MPRRIDYWKLEYNEAVSASKRAIEKLEVPECAMIIADGFGKYISANIWLHERMAETCKRYKEKA